MQNFIFRSAIIFLTALIQVSFLSVFFPGREIPFTIVAYTVSLTIIRGFKESLSWIIALSVIYDLISFDIPGASAAPLVAISYFTSFVSRKILISNKMLSWGIAALTSAGGALLMHVYYLGINMIKANPGSNFQTGIFFDDIHLLSFSILTTMVYLALTFRIMEKIENHLEFFEKKTLVKKA